MNKVIVGLTCLLLAIPCQAKIIYVDDDANGLNDGSSWQNAYNYLQDALADANSSQKLVEIRVAQGTYRPDEDTLHPNGTGIRGATFQLINGVTLKGGYAGFGQPDPNVRDIRLSETILSGDLDGNDVEVSDPCDLITEPTRAENSYHVVTGSETNGTAVLDGFTITCGKADDYSFLNDCGGGMCSFLGRPTISNCTFTANSAYWGGGMHNEVSSPTLTNCAFIGNAALTTPRGQAGGGISNWSGSSPVLTRCIFVRNFAYSSGGGICNDNDCNAILTNCVFAGNRANRIGGGMSVDESDITLVNCTFIGNLSSGGNGLAFDSPDHKFPSSARITNSILWDGGSEIQNYDNSTVVVEYSDIQGGWLGEGNIDVAPCFVDCNGRLSFNSPCIDAGDSNAVPSNIWTDLDGNPRFVDDPNTVDSGVGTPPIVDMGAYEFQDDVFKPGECYPQTYSSYGYWADLDKPNCWCGMYGNPRWSYQCDGDADNSTQGSTFRVFTNDFNILVANWKKLITDPTLNPCADFDHKPQGLQKFRVFTNDFNILVTNWKKYSSQLPGNCPRPE